LSLLFNDILSCLVLFELLYKLAAITDVGDEVLQMCCRNISANQHLRHLPPDSVLVRELDWLQSDLQTGS